MTEAIDNDQEVPETVSEWPRKGGSGNSSKKGWAVEARSVKDPVSMGGQIFAEKWRRVQFDECPFGVPSPKWGASHHGLLGYAQAQALRWWLHAASEEDRIFSALETRLIQHELIETYTINAVSDHAHIGFEDRSSIMPDWGKRK